MAWLKSCLMAAALAGFALTAAHASVYIDGLGTLTTTGSTSVVVPTNTVVDVTFTVAPGATVDDFNLNIFDKSSLLVGTNWTLTEGSMTIDAEPAFRVGGDYVTDFTDTLGPGSYTVTFSSAIPKGDTLEVGYTLSSAVPEPATWAMMVLGFLGVGFISCRRRSPGLNIRIA
jgi:hypothetical protein